MQIKVTSMEDFIKEIGKSDSIKVGNQDLLEAISYLTDKLDILYKDLIRLDKKEKQGIDIKQGIEIKNPLDFVFTEVFFENSAKYFFYLTDCVRAIEKARKEAYVNKEPIHNQ